MWQLLSVVCHVGYLTFQAVCTKKYQLECSFGVLSVSYSAGNMILFHSELVIPDDALGQIISLREAARKISSIVSFPVKQM